MMPSEIAMKMMSACNTCQGTKCLYRTQCGGKGQSCPLKEVAMTLRAQEARIASLEAEVQAKQDIIRADESEIESLKRINKDYYKLVNAFQQGYRPPKATKKGKPRRGRPIKKKPDPVEMDGDERYALETTYKPEPPMVLI